MADNPLPFSRTLTLRVSQLQNSPELLSQPGRQAADGCVRSIGRGVIVGGWKQHAGCCTKAAQAIAERLALAFPRPAHTLVQEKQQLQKLLQHYKAIAGGRQ